MYVHHSFSLHGTKTCAPPPPGTCSRRGTVQEYKFRECLQQRWGRGVAFQGYKRGPVNRTATSLQRAHFENDLVLEPPRRLVCAGWFQNDEIGMVGLSIFYGTPRTTSAPLP